MFPTLFALPASLLLEDVQIENDSFTLVLGSTLIEERCPLCHQPSSRIHSR